MSFLTKPTVVKGQPTTFTLVKSELALVAKIALDSFFSDITNWKRISIQFKNLEGQEQILIFDPSELPCTSIFSVSEKARSDFQITSLIIKDFDGGNISLVRSEFEEELLTDLDVPLVD